MKNKKLITFIVSLIVVYAVAGLGSVFTTGNTNSDWYNSVKPALTPPSYVFPIVWNILFFLIAVSLYFAWINSRKNEKTKVAVVFGINFVLNVMWSVFYFGMQNPVLAFFDILLLILPILSMILVTWKIKRISSWLLLPYLLWVCFASILNYLSIN